MPVIHGFDPPERFVAGHRRGARAADVLPAGPPGAKARRSPWRSSRCRPSASGSPTAGRADPDRGPDLRPGGDTGRPDDNEPLEQPIEEEFRAGTITLSWDAGDERVVIEVFPVVEAEVVLARSRSEDDLEEPEPEEVLLVRMPAGDGAFVRVRAESGFGRAGPCPFCGGPMDADGHLCPRANGYRRRDPDHLRPRPGELLEAELVAARSDHAGLEPTFLGEVDGARGSTSRTRGSGPCGTSPTARSRAGRSRPGWSPSIWAGTSSRRPVLRDGPPDGAWCSCGWSPRRRRTDPVDVVPEGAVPPGFLHVLDGVDGARPVSLVHEDTTRCAGWPSST